MTVAKVLVTPLPDLKDWYKVTLVSFRNSIGETTIELLVSEETLRMMRNQINKILPPNNHDNLAWMKED